MARKRSSAEPKKKTDEETDLETDQADQAGRDTERGNLSERENLMEKKSRLVTGPSMQAGNLMEKKDLTVIDQEVLAIPEVQQAGRDSKQADQGRNDRDPNFLRSITLTSVFFSNIFFP